MNRKFNFSDELLLPYCSTMVAYLDTDLPLFTSIDKDLNETKAKELTELMDAALQ